MRCVVFGATGGIGSKVAELLAHTEHELVVLVRDPSRLSPAVRSRARVIEGSHIDLTQATKASRGADAAFWMSPPAISNDVEGFMKQSASVAGAVAAGVDRIVNLSGAYCERPNFAAASLIRHIEHAIDAVNPNAVHLRAGLFMSNFLMQAQGINAGILSFPMPGHAPANFIAPADIAHVAAGAMLDISSRDRKALALVGPDRLTSAQAAEILSSELGKRIVYAEQDEAGTQALIKLGLPEQFVRSLAEMHNAFGRAFLAGDPPAGELRVGPTSFRQYARTTLAPALRAMVR